MRYASKLAFQGAISVAVQASGMPFNANASTSTLAAAIHYPAIRSAICTHWRGGHSDV